MDMIRSLGLIHGGTLTFTVMKELTLQLIIAQLIMLTTPIRFSIRITCTSTLSKIAGIVEPQSTLTFSSTE